MKRLYRNSILLIAAFLFAPLAMAQTTHEGIKLEKDVTGPDENGEYTITLGTFVNGKSVTTITQETRATDIVLVLDVSGSMDEELNMVIKTPYEGPLVTNPATRYIVEINGVEYYMVGWYDGWRDRHYYRYQQGSEPIQNANYGTRLGSSNYYSSQLSTSDFPDYKFYTYNNSPTRLDAMKDAAKKFVQTVYSKNPKVGDKHQIAIVKFAGMSGNFDMTADENGGQNRNGTRVIYNLTPVTSETQCDATINGLWAAGTTNAGKGMETALSVLTPIANNGHPKVVVFFTDGQPGTTTQAGFNAENARRAVTAAHSIKAISTTVTGEDGQSKVINGKVYSVALLTSGGQGDQVGHFLHYVSSNYDPTLSSSYNFASNPNPAPTNLDATWTGATGGGEAPHGYYFLTGGDNLSEIFESIANESSEGSASFSIKETSLVTVDVISNSFKLPDGVTADDPSRIEVLFAPMTGLLDNTKWNDDTYLKNLDNYVFGTPVTAEVAVANTTNPLKLVSGTNQYPSVLISKDDTQTPAGDKITVTNYNFADNYCGPDTKQDGTFNHWRGYKLVIKIPIVVDVANPGGASVNTNAEGSGIYVLNEETGKYETLADFPRPTVTLPNIIVRKYGLERYNESAQFKLEKMNDAGTAVDSSVDPYVFIISHDQSRRGFDFVQVKLQKPGTYRVTETTWSWNYTPSVSTKSLKGSTISPADANTNNDQVTGQGVDASQNYMIRTIGKETEQTDEVTGLTGAIFDFKNTVNTPKESLSDFNESNVVNPFPTKSVAPATPVTPVTP